jgi:hypothetical protein
VAVTIDTNDFPPKVLLSGVPRPVRRFGASPQGTIEAGHKMVGDDHYADWEAGVRGSYDSMVEIRITPPGRRSIDFETRIPAPSQSWSARSKLPADQISHARQVRNSAV